MLLAVQYITLAAFFHITHYTLQLIRINRLRIVS